MFSLSFDELQPAEWEAQQTGSGRRQMSVGMTEGAPATKTWGGRAGTAQMICVAEDRSEPSNKRW